MLNFSKATSVEAYVEEIEETIEVVDEEATAAAAAEAAAAEVAAAEAAAAAAAAAAAEADDVADVAPVDEGKKDGDGNEAKKTEEEEEGGKKSEPEIDEGKKDAEGKDDVTPPAAAEAAKLPVPPKMKKIVKKSKKRKFRDTWMDITFVYDGQPSKEMMMECEEVEAKMAQQDRLIKETDDARNDLETYVYSMRDAISSTLSEYVADEEKTAFAALLSSEEEWLYTDEGYDGDKKTFVRRLSTLQEQGLVFESR